MLYVSPTCDFVSRENPMQMPIGPVDEVFEHVDVVRMPEAHPRCDNRLPVGAVEVAAGDEMQLRVDPIQPTTQIDEATSSQVIQVVDRHSSCSTEGSGSRL